MSDQASSSSESASSGIQSNDSIAGIVQSVHDQWGLAALALIAITLLLWKLFPPDTTPNKVKVPLFVFVTGAFVWLTFVALTPSPVIIPSVNDKLVCDKTKILTGMSVKIPEGKCVQHVKWTAEGKFKLHNNGFESANIVSNGIVLKQLQIFCESCESDWSQHGGSGEFEILPGEVGELKYVILDSKNSDPEIPRGLSVKITERPKP